MAESIPDGPRDDASAPRDRQPTAPPGVPANTPGIVGTPLRVVVALALLAFGLWLHAAAAGTPLNPKFSTWWADFARAPTWSDAVDGYNFRRPPGYPALLFVAHHAGFPIRWVNAVLLAASVVLVHRLARRLLREVDPWFPAALYAVLACNYACYGQLVDEALLVPLALLAMWALLRDADAPTVARAAEMGVWCSAACLVRTFALVWIVPLCGVAALVHGPATFRRRALRAAAFGAIVLVPTALLMAWVRSRTGFATGMDRTAYDTRVPVPGIASFADETTAWATSLRIVRTFVLDFASPRRIAGISDAGDGFALGRLESLCAVAMGAGLAALGACHVLARRARAGDAARARAAPMPSSAASLTPLAACVGIFAAALVAVWAASNNDPVHSRYVLPVYPFAILLATAIHDRAAVGAPERWRVPVRALYVLTFAVQAWKVVTAAASLV